jgi:hypothetical protein
MVAGLALANALASVHKLKGTMRGLLSDSRRGTS